MSEALKRMLAPLTARGWVNESDALYRASPGLNCSSLKVLCSQTPAHFLHAIENPKAPTPAMRWGSLVHGFILERKEPKVMPDFTGKGAKARKEEWIAEQDPNTIFVDADEAYTLREMDRAVRSNDLAREVLERGLIEQSGYADTDLFPVKIRCDALMPEEGIIYDLKTCASASKDAFSRDAWNLGYHVQAAWYLTVANLIEQGRYTSFRWIALEKDAPYCVSIYEAGEDQMRAGSQAIGGALTTFTRCLDEDRWPGLSPEMSVLEVPAWAKKQLEGDFK